MLLNKLKTQRINYGHILEASHCSTEFLLSFDFPQSPIKTYDAILGV